MKENETKTVLLTGASRGIGHATAQVFAEAGWRVLTVSSGLFAVGLCPWQEGASQHLSVDLSRCADLDAASDRILAHLPDGRLHALINNAGISPKLGGGKRMGVMDCPPAIWRQTFDLNFFAIIHLVTALRHCLCRAGGSVVNVTSIAGHAVHPFAGAAYATSKAALSALTRELAYELGADGVRVNAVCPGEIDTSILSPGTDALVHREVPMGRLGLPEEVASVIYFLCSDAGSYVNGAEIPINGGQHV